MVMGTQALILWTSIQKTKVLVLFGVFWGVVFFLLQKRLITVTGSLFTSVFILLKPGISAQLQIKLRLTLVLEFLF